MNRMNMQCVLTRHDQRNDVPPYDRLHQTSRRGASSERETRVLAWLCGIKAETKEAESPGTIPARICRRANVGSSQRHQMGVEITRETCQYMSRARDVSPVQKLLYPRNHVAPCFLKPSMLLTFFSYRITDPASLRSQVAIITSGRRNRSAHSPMLGFPVG